MSVASSQHLDVGCDHNEATWHFLSAHWCDGGLPGDFFSTPDEHTQCHMFKKKKRICFYPHILHKKVSETISKITV